MTKELYYADHNIFSPELIKKQSPEATLIKESLVEEDASEEIRYLDSRDVSSKSSFLFNAIEKELIYLLLKSIKPKDHQYKEYKINPRTLKANIKAITGQSITVAELTQSVRNVSSIMYDFPTEDGGLLYAPLVVMSNLEFETQKITFSLSRTAQPFLTPIEGFSPEETLLKLTVAARLGTYPSMKLYEMLAAHRGPKKFTMSEKEIRRHLAVENRFKTWTVFEKNILEKPKSKINEVTGLEYDYTTYQEDNKTFITFEILKLDNIILDEIKQFFELKKLKEKKIYLRTGIKKASKNEQIKVESLPLFANETASI